VSLEVVKSCSAKQAVLTARAAGEADTAMGLLHSSREGAPTPNTMPLRVMIMKLCEGRLRRGPPHPLHLYEYDTRVCLHVTCTYVAHSALFSPFRASTSPYAAPESCLAATCQAQKFQVLEGVVDKLVLSSRSRPLSS
jgi:hypothetical protein